MPGPRTLADFMLELALVQDSGSMSVMAIYHQLTGEISGWIGTAEEVSSPSLARKQSRQSDKSGSRMHHA
jgi:hypothetical protein